MRDDKLKKIAFKIASLQIEYDNCTDEDKKKEIEKEMSSLSLNPKFTLVDLFRLDEMIQNYISIKKGK